jgi:integrase/recombinase XerC
MWYSRGMNYTQAVTQYINDPAKRFADSTRNNYRYALGKLDATNIEDVTEKQLVALLSDRKLSGTSQSNLIKIYRTFFSWAKWKGLVTEDPALNLGRIIAPNMNPVKTNSWLSKDEVKAFMALLPIGTELKRRNKVLFQLGFTTGLRRAELCGLTWGDINLKKASATVLGKGGKLASVYLTDATVAMLNAWKGDHTDGQYVLPPASSIWSEHGRKTELLWDTPLKPASLSSIVRQVSIDAGQRIATHDMRRSFAGIMNDLSDIEATSIAMRHSNIGTTQVYLEKRQDAAYQAGKLIGLDL